MKVWVTKYALTQGVYETSVDISQEFPKMATEFANQLQTYHGNDWHRTKPEAIKRAEDMRAAKLSSLAKSMKKIQALKFQ